MEDPVENKRKIHEHIRACRQVADKRCENIYLWQDLLSSLLIPVMVKTANGQETHYFILFSRLALNHAKQNPIAPGKFQQTITREKQNVAYDTDMH